MRILVTLADGFEEIEALSPVDVLRRCGAEVLLAKVAQSRGDLVAKSQSGTGILCDVMTRDVAAAMAAAETGAEDQTQSLGVDLVDFDAIVLPGGWNGTLGLAGSDEIKQILSFMQSRGKLISAICAAPLALATHGVLRERDFTCYPSIEAEIAKVDPTARHTNSASVVCDKNGDAMVLTSKGPGTALEFAFALAKVLFGAEKAAEVRAGMLA